MTVRAHRVTRDGSEDCGIFLSEKTVEEMALVRSWALAVSSAEGAANENKGPLRFVGGEEPEASALELAGLGRLDIVYCTLNSAFV